MGDKKRTYVYSEPHKRVKLFCERSDEIDRLPEAYKYIVTTVLDSGGRERPFLVPEDLTEGIHELVKDLSRTEDASEKEILLNLLKMGVDQVATKDYFMIDRINNEIQNLKQRIRKLKKVKKQYKEEEGKT